MDDDELNFDNVFPDFPDITEEQVQALEDSLWSDSWRSMDDDSGYTTFEDDSASISFDNPLNTAFTEEGGKKKRRK